MSMSAPAYPIGLDVDPAAPQSRLTVFFRYFMLIPHGIIVSALMAVVEVITFLAWFAILFTGKYPAGLLKFSMDTFHWSNRYTGYQWLLTGKYPPFAMGADDSYPIRTTGEGEGTGRNRITVFFRYPLLIPHLVVLSILAVAAIVILAISWLAALITGSVPAGMHSFMAGFTRWSTRVTAYALLLTDKYPPFSLS